MSNETGWRIERQTAAVMHQLDRLSASARKLDDLPNGGHASRTETLDRVRAQRERIAELQREVAAVRESVTDLADEARTAVALSLCDRIERREWPHGASAGGVGAPSMASGPTVAGEHVALARATAFIEAHAGESITVDDIADASRVSLRHLQGLFRRHHEVAPMGYLRRVRLDHAHDDLCVADPTRGDTVDTVARRWQFTHVGRFASAYRQRFGCPPSTTLRVAPPAPTDTTVPAAQTGR